MCGIVGKLNFQGIPIRQEIIRQMCVRIIHRGPDEDGFYFNGPVGLGMRRLSIIDVAGGSQPISNEDGTVWLVVNGEIYNYLELRKGLEVRGHSFKTNTDVEVIIHLYEEMGAACVRQFNGMFAFTIWDARRQRLLLARDRLGKKPLHYAMTPQGLTFGSEIAALLEDPEIPRRVNYLALAQYLRLWYVPHPLTMFEGILKLPPAHTLVCENGQVRVERYWDVDFSPKLELSDGEWSERILALLQDAVRIRLISDVPLGALLSGGIDSSMVVALMGKVSNRAVQTFSIGFDEGEYNELPYARRVADRLGTDHHDEVVRPDAAAVLPELVRHYGEPFGDESCIPTYYVARQARKHVTVALGGDGGDENFGGYPRLARYQAFSPYHSLRGLLSSQVKEVLATQSPLRTSFSSGTWKTFFGEAAYRIREIRDPMERYAHEWITWKDGTEGILGPAARRGVGRQRVLARLDAIWQRTQGWSPIDRLLYLEIMTYLPDDLQVKIDIASMAASLEVRSPFLDYRLVELAASMPDRLKFRGGQTKALLREIAATLLPEDICARGKWGFSMPIKHWLSGGLRPMVEDLLLQARTVQHGIFNGEVVRGLVAKQFSGQADYSRHLWLLLNFELWYREFLA